MIVVVGRKEGWRLVGVGRKAYRPVRRACAPST